MENLDWGGPGLGRLGLAMAAFRKKIIFKLEGSLVIIKKFLIFG